MPIVTGLTGNEIFCLSEKGFTAGDLVVGNSVFAIGLQKGLVSGWQIMAGGEVSPITELIKDGRQRAYDRLINEAKHHGGNGITGVSIDLIQHLNCQKYLCLGSVIKAANRKFFSTCADGQDLYCQMDAGYDPVSFVFGNVAYSIGFGGGIQGSLKSLQRGEVHQFSEILYKTRHLALERIIAEAKNDGANAVLGIQTVIRPFNEMQEMLMSGTASHNPDLPASFTERPATSSLTNVELWSLTKMGYAPLELLMGVSVYSLGIVGGITASLKQIAGGEIKELTDLIYDAREHAITQMKKDAKERGADQVMGLRTFVYDLGGGMLEFLSIGTAVVKLPNLKTASATLIPQAIVRERRVELSNTSSRPISDSASQNSDSPVPWGLNPEGQLANAASNAVLRSLPFNNPIVSFIIPIFIILLFLSPLLLADVSGITDQVRRVIALLCIELRSSQQYFWRGWWSHHTQTTNSPGHRLL